ncbi:hypothetical protein pb186bvf_000708 [Paramecium bursaria]
MIPELSGKQNLCGSSFINLSASYLTLFILLLFIVYKYTHKTCHISMQQQILEGIEGQLELQTNQFKLNDTFFLEAITGRKNKIDVQNAAYQWKNSFPLAKDIASILYLYLSAFSIYMALNSSILVQMALEKLFPIIIKNNYKKKQIGFLYFLKPYKLLIKFNKKNIQIRTYTFFLRRIFKLKTDYYLLQIQRQNISLQFFKKNIQIKE